MTDIKIVRSAVTFTETPSHVLVDDLPSSLFQELLEVMGDSAIDIFDDAFTFSHSHANEVKKFLENRGVIIKKKQNPATAENDGVPGIMIAFWVPHDIGQKLAVPDGELVKEMHLTLVYLGKADKVESAKLGAVKSCLQKLAQVYEPMEGKVAGIGRFSNGEQDVLHACVDVPGMSAFREAIYAACQKLGVQPASNHGFDPHITMKYLDEGEPSPMERLEAMPIKFDHVWLCVGDARESFKLGCPVR